MRKFLYDESGVEVIQWLCILGVTAGMVAIMATASDTVKAKLTSLIGNI